MIRPVCSSTIFTLLSMITYSMSFSNKVYAFELVHAVDAALDAVILHELLFLLELLFPGLAVVDADQFRGQIRHGEEVLVLHVADEVLDALLRELDLFCFSSITKKSPRRPCASRAGCPRGSTPPS